MLFDEVKKSMSGKKFIICVFGESGAGKSTLLRSMMHDIIDNSKLSICDAEGFYKRDRRVVAWYQTGKSKQGVVSICTAGDSEAIIKANIKFFEKHINCWDDWFDQPKESNGTRKKNEKGKLAKIPRILITAARKPLMCYKGLQEFIGGYEVLNIPITLDVWKYCKGEDIPKGAVEWSHSNRTVEASLFQHLRYILINKQVKRPFARKSKYDFRLLQKGKEQAIALLAK